MLAEGRSQKGETQAYRPTSVLIGTGPDADHGGTIIGNQCLYLRQRSVTQTSLNDGSLITLESTVPRRLLSSRTTSTEIAMQLSKMGYYSDFVVYPAIILVLAMIELRPPESVGRLEWLITCFFGITVWTLAEYLIHRFVFHRVPIVARMHDAHHSRPSALIGTPIWSSISAFTFGVFIPLWWQAGFNMASGLTSGLMLGYLWYILVHTAVHRSRLDRGSFLYRAKLRHARHHYGRQEGNFGVTTDFWDRFFGTAISN